MPLESFGAVARWLRETKGFKQVRPTLEGAKAFRGTIQCGAHSIGIRLEIVDWDFVDYPHLFLESVPAELKGFRPHVMESGDLCYLQRGSIVLDRFRPAEATARCLLQAQQTLEELASAQEYRFEAHDEFGFYWTEVPVFTGSIDPAKGRARLLWVESVDRNFHVLTQEPAEADWLARSVSGKVQSKMEIPVWLIASERYPSVDQEGLPHTIKETLAWLKRWDSAASRGLESLLEQKEYLNQPIVAFLFSSPVGWFGFVLELDPIHRASYKRKPARYRQFLYAKGGATVVKRIHGVDVSPAFVHTRNVDSPSLLGKRVAVIGCGAIGGYIAHGLIRLGAGAGPKGRLTLIDPESVLPGNLGRHVLGFPALLLSKAEALKDQLSAEFPYASVRAFTGDAREYTQLFEEDLIIEATGDEAFSIALGRLHQERLQASLLAPPVLHAWIAGNGEAAQALFVDGKKGGCYRCMWVDEADGKMRDRFPLLKNDVKVKYLGCQAVTMFPVSAAMSGAALAADMVIDWLRGDPSPRFRTRIRENADAFAVKNQNLPRIESCPACRRT
jgi:molybdopterin/thiamine biosynthesis adenylyltransferase